MFSAAADLQFSSDTYPRDSVRYAHLLEGGRILLGLMDGLRNIAVFVESLSHIEAAIQRRYLQGNSTGTRLAKVANLPLMSRRCMLNVYSFARVRPSFGLVCFRSRMLQPQYIQLSNFPLLLSDAFSQTGLAVATASTTCGLLLQTVHAHSLFKKMEVCPP